LGTCLPAWGQTAGLAGAQGTAFIPDFSGIWGNRSSPAAWSAAVRFSPIGMPILKQPYQITIL